MGSDTAPFSANPFLFYYEWKYMHNIKGKNVNPARKFCHAFSFIDDLITVNK